MGLAVMTTTDDSATAAPCKRILLLDDEPSILAPMGRYFTKLGCCVELATEPEEASALIAHRRYDLAILDLRLNRFPNADGLDVLREIRRRDHWTSVIILSAYASPEMEEEAIRLGADAVLRKPQPLADLAQLALALMGDGQ
jgi:CheY-like chemotaxis protein